MIMLCTCVNAEFLEHFCAERVLGKHALNCLVHCEFGFFRHQFLVLDFLESADVTGVIAIVLIFEFVARENDFVAVDYDNVVAAVDVGSVLWFIFALQDSSNLRSETTENHLLSTSPGFAI